MNCRYIPREVEHFDLRVLPHRLLQCRHRHYLLVRIIDGDRVDLGSARATFPVSEVIARGFFVRIPRALIELGILHWLRGRTQAR